MNHPRCVAQVRVLLAIFFGVMSPVTVSAQAEFLEAAQAFRGQAQVLSEDAIEVHIAVEPGYHLYRDRISVVPDGTHATIGSVDLPAGKVSFDDTFQRHVEKLDGAVRIRVPVKQANADFGVRVNYQGCADQGLCYLPQTAFVAIGIDGGKVTRASWHNEAPSLPAEAPELAPAVPSSPEPAASPSSDLARITSALRSGSLPTIAGVFLIAGLLLAFTPCVLPMVPILSSIIVGQGAPVSRMRGFAMALAYSMGMALVYTCFGVAAGLLGEGLAAAMQNPWVLSAFAFVLATLALSMFGIFDLQMPSAIQNRATKASDRLPGGKVVGVFLMGGLSALIVGPCVAAPLAGALVFISQTRDVVIGGLALFSLAMGMSVPLLLVGMSAGALLPRAGAWMVGIKTFFGAMLLAVALWIVSPVLPNWALMGLIGAAMLIGASCLNHGDRSADAASVGRRFRKGLALLAAVLGSAQILGALSGGNDPIQPLRHLARSREDAKETSPHGTVFRRVRSVTELEAELEAADRPVLLDFYADWCVSCKEMERLTFNDPAIRARLGNAVLLQADVTDNSPDDKALLKRYGLFGPPGVLFFNTAGEEYAEARLIGFAPPARFSALLAVAGL